MSPQLTLGEVGAYRPPTLQALSIANTDPVVIEEDCARNSKDFPTLFSLNTVKRNDVEFTFLCLLEGQTNFDFQ